MTNAVKRIGVLTSGGDAPGMNAAVRAVVRARQSYRGIECIGIRRGYQRADQRRLRPPRWKTASHHIINRGGTMLYTARSEEFAHPGRASRRAADNLPACWGMEGIVGVGGDGTFRGLQALFQAGHQRRRRPRRRSTTTSSAPTTPSATTPRQIPPWRQSTRLRDTMQSHERCSGRRGHGQKRRAIWRCMSVWPTGATSVLVPEKKRRTSSTTSSTCIRGARLSGKTHYMIIVAEGAGSAI